MAQSAGGAAATNARSDLWAGIRPEDLWQGRTGRGVRVAVVDSGIDTNHPALKGKVKGSVEAVPEGGQITFKPSTSGDQAGHGTACAGLITRMTPGRCLHNVQLVAANARLPRVTLL